MNDDSQNQNYTTLEKPKSTLTLDKITNESSLSKYPKLNFLNSSICLFIDGIEINLFIFLLIPLKDYFQFSNTYEEFCASIIFFGFAIGSFITGYITKIYGRTLTLKIISISIVFFHLLFIIFFNKVIFFIIRFFMGISLGLYVVIFLNLFGEYRPITTRGFHLILLWAMYQFACLIQILIGLIVMPNYEKNRLRGLISIYLIFPIIGSVIHYFTLFDSPRNLIVNGEKDLAFYILKDMNKNIELSDDDKLKIENEVNVISSNKNIRNHIYDLFNKDLSQTTILLFLTFFILSGAYYGMNVLTSITQKKLNGNKNEKNHNVIISQLTFTLITLIICISSAFIIELKFIGRKGLMVICFILAAIVSIPSVYIKGGYGILIGIYISATFISANTLITYVVEIYPTKLRDLSTGFQFMCYRIFCGFAQIWMLALFHINFRLPYFIYCFLCIFGGLLIYILPYETKDRPLDSKYHNTETDNLNISQNDNLFKQN